jgi:hypothetical protein
MQPRYEACVGRLGIESRHRKKNPSHLRFRLQGPKYPVCNCSSDDLDHIVDERQTVIQRFSFFFHLFIFEIANTTGTIAVEAAG